MLVVNVETTITYAPSQELYVEYLDYPPPDNTRHRREFLFSIFYFLLPAFTLYSDIIIT